MLTGKSCRVPTAIAASIARVTRACCGAWRTIMGISRRPSWPPTWTTSNSRFLAPTSYDLYNRRMTELEVHSSGRFTIDTAKEASKVRPALPATSTRGTWWVLLLLAVWIGLFFLPQPLSDLFEVIGDSTTLLGVCIYGISGGKPAGWKSIPEVDLNPGPQTRSSARLPCC